MKKKNIQETGITLVALVVTIIVLLILAGVTINMALSNNGLIQRAKDASETYAQAEQNEQNALAYFSEEVGKYTGDNPPGDSSKKITDSGVKPASPTTEVTPLSTEKTTDLEDNKGNIVKVPKNFGIAYDSADNVAEGIVIEYTGTSESDPLIGNQYVWIPVGQEITKTDGTTIPAITLGRYNFDAEPNSSYSEVVGTGEATLAQNAANWQSAKEISVYYFGFNVYEYAADDTAANSYENTKASNLSGFINSATSNHGYYIARYEAGSGASNSKPYTQKDKTAWTEITQPDAAAACQNMYEGAMSDLVNSYAWDTAIVYIQKCTGSNGYAVENRGSNKSKVNTGVTGDEQCKINDMAKNVAEWTTESSTYSNNGFVSPCVNRGGDYGRKDSSTAIRYDSETNTSTDNIGFRPILYL